MRLKDWATAWDEFFFRPVSPVPVALFRIAFGMLTIIMLVTQNMPDWDFWYGAAAPVQIETVRNYFFPCPVFSFLDIVPPGASQIFMWLVFASAVFVTIGFFTRLSTAFLWLSLVTIHHRCPWNISGCDDFMRLATFCMIFSAAGEVLSVDSWIKRKFFGQNPRAVCAPWGQRMIQIQLALAYWGASVAKIGGNQWVDGTAVYYSSHMEDFFRLPVGHMLDNLAFCQFLSWGTLVVETSLWTLIWFKECRYWVLLAGVLLHIGIDYTMTLPVFEMEFVAAYLCFIEPEDLTKLWNWLRNPLAKPPAAASGALSHSVTVADGQMG